jgi:hypothetical protein
MPEQATYVIAISNGILEHCERIGVAIWVFLWMVDHTTKEVPGADGQTEGHVRGGFAVRARDIAADLQMPVRTVQAHLALLFDRGYLRRVNLEDGTGWAYLVQKSKKWALRKRGGSEPTPEREPAQNSAGGAQNSARGAQNSAPTAQNSAPYIEDNTELHKDNTVTKTKAPAAFVLPAWVPVEQWNHFVEMRKRMRKAPTDHAKHLLVEKLARLAASGQDPGEILDRSTEGGWTGLWELKSGGNGNGNGNRAQTNLDSALAGGRAALASLGFDYLSADEAGGDDGGAGRQGGRETTIDGRRPRGLTD